jgi:predicted nuclease with TOPRIM domain
MTDDSLWLQKSINISDPLDASFESSRNSNTSKGSMNAAELDMIAMRPARLSDGLRQGRAASSARLSSIANAMGGFNPFEVDELKGKLAQLNREKLRWEDSARDLERSKTELQQARDDYRALEEYTQTIKAAADESAVRAERDAKARQEAESKLLDAMRNASKEQLALKSQIDEVKKSQAHKLFEMKESLETERASDAARFAQEQEDVAREHERKTAEMEKQAQELLAKLVTTEAAANLAKDTLAQREQELLDRYSQLQKELAATRNNAADQAKQIQQRMDTMQREHIDAMDHAKAMAAEQLHVAREEAKSVHESLQHRLHSMEEKYDRTKEELFSARTEAQTHQVTIKQQRAAHQTAMENATELHTKELERSRLDLCSVQNTLLEIQNLFSEEQQKHRAVIGRLTAEQSTTRDLSDKLSTVTSELNHIEEKFQSALAEIESREAELDELAEMMQRKNNEHEVTVKGWTDDLSDLRVKCANLETDLSAARLNLSNERKAHLATDGSFRRTIAELREQLTQATSTNVSAHTLDIETQQQLRRECDAMANRANFLDDENKKLREEASRLETIAKRHRGGLADISTNIAQAIREPSAKKHRSEPTKRVFAVSGFEGQDLKLIKETIEQLPNSSLVECRSNAPLPASVTHLVASGQLTVKLLSAAVKGCWIVSKDYIQGSMDGGDWCDEHSCGSFRHEQQPLFGKTVFFTPSFKSSKHFSTAKLLVDQGGATSTTDSNADIVLGISSEASRIPQGRSWESFVNDIYPVAA